MTQDRDQRTSFGYRDVAASQKAGLVRGVFDGVASRYDLMNDLMSAGVHRLWKSATVDRLNPLPGQRLIDVAGGTGDIAARFLRRADDRPGAADRSPATAVICDINEEMLRAGLGRADQRFADARLARVAGDAECLPFRDGAAEVYTIAFGIRNVTDIDAALREAYRVLRPGGRFACLEFSHPITEGLQALYDAYSFAVIPRLGEAVAGDGEAYRYLVESIRRFPAQDAFAGRIEQAGFSRVGYVNFTGGVAALHTGWRI